MYICTGAKEKGGIYILQNNKSSEVNKKKKKHQTSFKQKYLENKQKQKNNSTELFICKSSKMFLLLLHTLWSTYVCPKKSVNINVQTTINRNNCELFGYF